MKRILMLTSICFLLVVLSACINGATQNPINTASLTATPQNTANITPEVTATPIATESIPSPTETYTEIENNICDIESLIDVDTIPEYARIGIGEFDYSMQINCPDQFLEGWYARFYNVSADEYAEYIDKIGKHKIGLSEENDLLFDWGKITIDYFSDTFEMGVNWYIYSE